MAFLMESMSEKWVPFRTDLILGRGKSHMGPDRGNVGGCSKVAMFLLCKKLTNTQGCVSRSIIVMERPCEGFFHTASLPMESSSQIILTVS